MLLALQLALVMGALTSVPPVPDETAVTVLVLRFVMNTTYGGDAVAEPAHRRGVLLHRVTIAPSAEQLRVRVFSPANKDPEQLYGGLRAAGAVTDLQPAQQDGGAHQGS